MKGALNSWFRFWFWIDLLGIGLSFFLLAFYFFADTYPEKVTGFSKDIGLTFLGTWISVRVIDGLLKKREKYNHVRLEVLGNLKYFFDTAAFIYSISVPSETDIDKLSDEIKSFKRRWDKRMLQFSPKEIAQVNEIVALQPQIVETARQIKRSNSREQDELNEINRIGLKFQLDKYKLLLEKLKSDVWKETSPDD
jgi:hypothetical protein